MRRVALVLLLLLAAACTDPDPPGPGSGSGSTAPTTASGATTTAPPMDPAQARASLVKVADVRNPTAIAVRPGDDSLYVADKTGQVRRVPRGQTASPAPVDANLVLDLSGQVSTGSEQGLLGLTFSPDGSKLYVHYTDRAGDSQVVEYGFRDGAADPGTRRLLLSLDQPFANHNGGQVSFGPDGKLYIGFGDGGSQGDPNNRGQTLDTLFAKILRIDPQPAGPDQPYTVPPDNPFVGRSGAVGETWMYGLRNPWRFSWDRATGDLWIADVGQNQWEEIDYLADGGPAGTNFGWNRMEGRHRFRGDNPDGAVLPIFEYSHDEGCSITGGHVYRGTAVPSLSGVYVYGDACSGTIWGLAQRGGEVIGQAELQLAGIDAALRGGGGYSIASFGEDANGELYLLVLGSGVFRFAP